MFRTHEIHHQGVQSCTLLKLLVMVHRHLSCARSVFGSVILNCNVLPDDGSHGTRNMLE
jgi:hypothetical protein